jgi:hypothetical protein
MREWRQSSTIPDLGTKERWVVSFMHRSLCLREKNATVPFGQTVGWAPEPVLTLWNSLQLLAHSGYPRADFSTLKMEAIRSSERSVNAKSTQRHIPEDDILHSHRCENLKSYIVFLRFQREYFTSSKFSHWNVSGSWCCINMAGSN